MGTLSSIVKSILTSDAMSGKNYKRFHEFLADACSDNNAGLLPDPRPKHHFFKNKSLLILLIFIITFDFFPTFLVFLVVYLARFA